MIEWQDLHHSELSVSQLYALLQLRCAVFVVEQNCPYQDIDGDDLTGDNRHILGWKNDELVAYARILKSDDDLEPVVTGQLPERAPLCRAHLRRWFSLPVRLIASSPFCPASVVLAWWLNVTQARA